MQHVNFCISENEFLEFLTSSQLEPFVNKLISEKSKVTCSYCFESFICIKRLRCKVKNLYRRDLTRHGGGLMLLVKKNLTITSIKSDPCFETIELLFEIRKSEKVALLACNRPQIQSEGFLNSFEEKVMNIVGTVDDIIIAGDLNYDMSLKHIPLHDLCDSLGFNNVVKTYSS